MTDWIESFFSRHSSRQAPFDGRRLIGDPGAQPSDRSRTKSAGVASRSFCLVSFSFSVLLIQASCQSKFEEKPPVAQSVKPEAEKSQLQRAQAFHDRIAKAQNLIQSLGTALKKIKTPEITKLTISDLLVQIMDSVKESQVEGPSSQSVSHGEIYLPIPGLTAECRIVRTLSLFS